MRKVNREVTLGYSDKANYGLPANIDTSHKEDSGNGDDQIDEVYE